jgi:hypothetical protein
MLFSSRLVSPSHPGGAAVPSAAAVALAAELVGATPNTPGRRAIFTSTGLVAVEVVDRFTERTIDLHRAVIADALADQAFDLLTAFREVRIDGHQLAYYRSQLPRTVTDQEEGC